MEAGRQGEWAYRFRFTTEPHRPAYIRLFYVVLGHISSWLALAPEVTFQSARWLLGFVALFILYRLMQQIFSNLYWARVAFLLAALGSGLGWLQLIFNWTSSKITPIDFWLIDDYIFFSLSVFPHFAFVTAGMCIALSLWLDFLKKAALDKCYLDWIDVHSGAICESNRVCYSGREPFGGNIVLMVASSKDPQRRHRCITRHRDGSDSRACIQFPCTKQ